MTKVKPKKVKMDTYVSDIQEAFKERYPSSVPDLFTIDRILKLFWDYIEESLVNKNTVSIYGFGKFSIHGKYGKKGTGKERFQYYPKFTWSRHALARMREQLGTATEAEIRSMEKSRNFMKEVWQKRHNYMLEKRGTIPSSLVQTLLHLAEERNDKEYLTPLEKMGIISDVSTNMENLEQ